MFSIFSYFSRLYMQLPLKKEEDCICNVPWISLSTVHACLTVIYLLVPLWAKVEDGTYVWISKCCDILVQ